MNIGIDFGGVLSIHDNAGAEHINTTIDMPYALEALQQLKNDGHTLFLISFCGRKRAYETHKTILMHPGLFEREIYVKDRADKGKICASLGCHFMIDDRQDVIDAVITDSKMTHTILFTEELGWLNVLDEIRNSRKIKIQPNGRNIDRYVYHL